MTKTIGQKIKLIMDYYGCSDYGKVGEFSDKVGLSRQVLGNILNEKTKSPSIHVGIGILKGIPEISSDWFMRDIGEMIKEPAKKGGKPPVDFTPKIEADRALQDKVLTLESAIKDKKK